MLKIPSLICSQLIISVHVTLGVIFLFVLSALGNGIAVAQSTPWSSPVPVSPNIASASYPRLVVDQSGRVHLLWSQKEKLDASPIPGTSLYYSSRDPLTSRWTTPNSVIISSDFSTTHRPSLLYDSFGRLHAVWVGRVVNYAWAALDPLPASVWAWSPPVLIGDGVWDERVTEWTIDGKGNIHLVWESANRDPSRGANRDFLGYSIKYARTGDQGKRWTTPKTISLLDDRPFIPRIFADSAGRIFVAWWSNDREVEGGPGNYILARSVDSGETFQTRTLARGNVSGAAAIPPMAFAEVKGRLIILWADSQRLYASTSTDGGAQWSEAKSIWNEPTLRSLVDVAVDSAGIVHAFTLSSAPDGILITHHIFEKEAWRVAERLPMMRDVSTGEMTEIRATISQGNRLHLVYSLVDVRMRPTERLQVYYTTRMLDAPPVVTEPVPTVAQPARPTPTLLFTPTAQRTVLRAATSVPLRTPFANEQAPDMQNSAIYALGLPVLLVIGLVVLMIAFRARIR